MTDHDEPTIAAPTSIRHFLLYATDSDGATYTVELVNGALKFSHLPEVFWPNVARIFAQMKPLLQPDGGVMVTDQMILRACEAHREVQHEQNENVDNRPPWETSQDRQRDRMRAALGAALGVGK